MAIKRNRVDDKECRFCRKENPKGFTLIRDNNGETSHFCSLKCLVYDIMEYAMDKSKSSAIYKQLKEIVRGVK